MKVNFSNAYEEPAEILPWQYSPKANLPTNLLPNAKGTHLMALTR